MRAFCFLSIFAIIFLCISTVFASPRVTIKDGILEGSVLQSRKGRDILAFRGIPYARAPVGQLRFQPPQPPAPWTGVHPAKSDGAMCLQKLDLDPNSTKLTGSEDCLYINVYTPNLPNPNGNSSSKPLAVMVWFHGGAWTAGSANSSMFGPKFLLDHDIVLVTSNYRLGALGFLSTADSVIPGNYALKDHVRALRWVQENIAAFGGDPKRVTIAGESAGAASVHYLIISRMTKGLFHQAICQSGTAINPWSFNTAELAKNTALRLGRELNCSTNTSEGLLQCLRMKDPEDIIAKSAGWGMTTGDLGIPFRPVVEPNDPSAFLIEDPSVSLEHCEFANVTWLTGINADEGAFIARTIYEGFTGINPDILNSNFPEIAPLILGYAINCSKLSRDEISRRIRKYYIGEREINESTRRNVLNMSSDALFKIASASAVKAHIRVNDSVYYYYLAYNGDLKNMTIGGDPEKDYGVAHADDLLYLFPVHGVLYPNSTMSERDFQMVDVMTTLWTNFVRFGKPVPEPTVMLPVKWDPVTTASLENFIIESPTSLRMSKDGFKDTLNLWSSLPCRAGLSPMSKLNALRDNIGDTKVF